MRLINSEDIPYTMLYKENWMKGTGEEAQGAWKSDIDKMPTIDAVPRKAFDGILWENDVMRKQLAGIGKSFGAKMDDVVWVVWCKDCKWWNPHGKETPASIPALGECLFKDRKFETACWEFCFWGEREDNADN